MYFSKKEKNNTDNETSTKGITAWGSILLFSKLSHELVRHA